MIKQKIGVKKLYFLRGISKGFSIFYDILIFLIESLVLKISVYILYVF
jgi:hypothetical protein